MQLDLALWRERFPHIFMGIGLLIPIAACAISGIAGIIDPELYTCPDGVDPLSCWTPVDYAIVLCGACTVPTWILGALWLYLNNIPALR